MRLGTIQRDVMAFLARNGGRGYIGSITRAPEFRGYDLEQVERSLAALMRRGVIRRVGICYELAATERGSTQATRDQAVHSEPGRSRTL
jgi:hypothetical protein